MKIKRRYKLESTMLINLLDKISRFFELLLGALILLIIMVKIFDVVFVILDWNFVILSMEIENILSLIFTLVIGIEFTKMLCKHTPETVLDVLLFVIARQMIILVEGTFNMLIGVPAIAGIFAAKKYLVDAKKFRDEELFLEEITTEEAGEEIS